MSPGTLLDFEEAPPSLQETAEKKTLSDKIRFIKKSGFGSLTKENYVEKNTK